MPIVAGDIDYFLSGGGANSDPDASLGAAISSTEIVDASIHNLFDVVGSAEAKTRMARSRSRAPRSTS